MQFHSQGFHNMLSDSTRLPDDKSECEVMITAILRKERPLLDADVSWIEKDVVAYEQELFDLEIQVTQLIRQRERLECSLSRRKSVLSPIHRLPRDIIVEVFRWVVHHPKNSLDATKGVWPLGQVCGWWRDIVSTSPVLWSVVILNPPYTRHSVDILTHHFCRSAESPLWIAVKTGDSTNDGRVFDMVIQKSGLWKMVCINAPLTNLEMLSSISGNIPLLEELYVFCRRQAHFSTDALSSAPSLRRADLEAMEISHLPLNASLLTHFTGTLYHLADIQYIAPIQTLIDIRILFCDNPDGPLDSGNLLPVEMEQLQFLSVTDVRILDALTTPSLRKFDYRPGSISNEGDTDIRPLRDFLARSACSIEHLCICVEMIQKVHHLMALAKNVSYLTVYYSKGHPALDPLTLPETLPMMKSLRLVITDTGWRRRYPGGIIDVVRQRFNEERAAVLNVTKLSCLRIDCVDDSRAEFIDRLKGEGLDALEEEGLELKKGSPYLRVDEYWTGSWFT
ncbi:hypothetical protein EV421DRAFT_2037594 [Armillaria borealis]|uniref:F-box domain-containing protein n=1 Tax=Armillaria borealis TaxID=47425 RepID=A0AA39JCW3_9AGAR|nr:hypothetical protein EV421DRAFT_2037594 [Armillaria borealis]